MGPRGPPGRGAAVGPGAVGQAGGGRSACCRVPRRWGLAIFEAIFVILLFLSIYLVFGTI
jgi:hypothetical protein